MHATLPPLASRRIPLLALLALGIASATMSPAQEGAMSDEAAAREADEMVEGFANTTADGIGEIDAPVAASVTKTVSATAAAAAEVASDAAGDAAGEAEPAAKSPVQPGIGTRLGMVLAHLPAGLLIGALVLATIGGAKSTRTYEKGVVGLLGGAALAAPLGALASYLLTHRGIPTGTLPEWLSPLGGATYLALVFAYFFRKKCLAEEVFAMPQRRRRASDSVKLKEKRQANLFIGARVASIAMTLLAVAASLGVGGLGENPFAKLKPEAIAAVAKGLAENDGSPKEKTPPSEPEPPKPAPPQAAPEPAVPTPAPTPAPAPVVAEVTPPSDPGDGPPPPIVQPKIPIRPQNPRRLPNRSSPWRTRRPRLPRQPRRLRRPRLSLPRRRTRRWRRRPKRRLSCRRRSSRSSSARSWCPAAWTATGSRSRKASCASIRPIGSGRAAKAGRSSSPASRTRVRFTSARRSSPMMPTSCRSRATR
ncbi:MAG: hypothetical protein R3F11_29790 [Verrucomicrobiales bacterium]